MTPKLHRRRTILDIAARRAGPGSGSHPEELREAPGPYGYRDLRPFLGSVRYAIVGGLATRLYMPERATLDADVLIRLEDWLLRNPHCALQSAARSVR